MLGNYSIHITVEITKNECEEEDPGQTDLRAFSSSEEHGGNGNTNAQGNNTLKRCSQCGAVGYNVRTCGRHGVE